MYAARFSLFVFLREREICLYLCVIFYSDERVGSDARSSLVAIGGAERCCGVLFVFSPAHVSLCVARCVPRTRPNRLAQISSSVFCAVVAVCLFDRLVSHSVQQTSQRVLLIKKTYGIHHGIG